MQFLNPIAFWLFLLAVPIVLFYLLKVRLTEKPVSTMLFWQQVFDERRSRSLWRRLRYWLSLLISLLFLFLLVTSILNPVRCSPSRTHFVIILDNSASMNAREANGELRFEMAQKSLDRLLVAGDDREAALLTCGGRPTIVSGWTSPMQSLCRTVRSLEPTEAPGRLNETLDLAMNLIRGRSDSVVFVLTDGCGALAEKWKDNPKVVFLPIGHPHSNTGITRFQPRRSASDPTSYEVFIELSRFGGTADECRLELDLDGNPIDVIPVKLEPGKRVVKVIPAVSESGGILTATLTGNDALATDNTARAFLSGRVSQKILLPRRPGFFLGHVLQSQSLTELQETGGAIPKEVPSHSVLVLEGSVPFKLPKGNLILVDPTSETELFRVEPLKNTPLVGSQAEDSPIMRHVQLTNILIPGANRIVPKSKSGCRILAQTPEGDPLFLLFERSEGNVLVLSADLNRGDFALRTSFPIIMTNTLDWYRLELGEYESASSTGDFVTVPSEARNDRLILRSPSGTTKILTPDFSSRVAKTAPSIEEPNSNKTQAENKSQVNLKTGSGAEKRSGIEFQSQIGTGERLAGPLDRTGIWRLEREDGTILRTFACNMNSSEESDLSVDVSTFFSLEKDSQLTIVPDPPIWYRLILVAIGLTLVEWHLYQRRWID